MYIVDSLNKIKNFAKLVLLISFSLLFMTCDPGLGKAVDTQAPKVAVEFPVTKSVLKGGFTMKGVASDEVKVASCVVTFKNMKTSDEYSFNASVEDGTFTVSINAPKADGAFELPDGDYNVTVTVSDSYRNSTADVVYTIDNTAPTVLITSPNSYSISNWPNMYKTFNIKGEVYDSSTLESVTVYLVDDRGTVLKSVLADGTNTFLASFDTPFNEEIICFYYAVAKDAGGNENTYCYHKSDIFQLLSESKNVQTVETDSETSIVFPSINKIGYVDQGQESNLTEMLSREDLVAKKIENSAQKIVAGKYVFPGFNYFKDNAAQIKWLNISSDVSQVAGIAIGSPVLGTIMPPTDGSAINYDNVYVWVSKIPYDIKNSEDFNTPEEFKKYLNETLFIDSNKLESCVVSEGETGDKQVKLTAVGESLNFQVDSCIPGQEGNDWPSGFYYIKVQFTTESGVTNYDYCKFEVTSGAPKLTEGIFAQGKENSSYYRGYITSKSIDEGLGGKALTSDENQAVELAWSYSGVTVAGQDISSEEKRIPPKADGTYTIAISHETDGEYTYTLTAAPDAEISTVISRVVVVDTTAPVVEFSTITDGDIIESSDFIVKGNIDDANGIELVEYLLQENGTGGTWQEIPKAKSSFNLSLSELKENITYTLKVRATDVAGNICGNDDYKCDFTIDLANPVATIEAPLPEENSSIVFVKEIPSFSGKASDNAVTAGKLAQNATLSFTKDGGSVIQVQEGTSAGQFNWNQSEGTWTWTPISTQFDGTGKYDVTLKVTDNAGKSTSITRTVSLDSSVPTIKLTQVTPYVDRRTVEEGQSQYYVNGEISVKFDITENDYIREIKWYKPDGTEDSQNLGTNAQPTVKIATTDFTDGTKLGQFKLVVTDRSGNQGVYTAQDLSSYEINQDSDKPTIEIAGINPSVTTEQGISAEQNLFSTSDVFTFTLKDDDGVASGTYQIDSGDVKTINGGNAKVKTETVTLNSLAQGPHTIKLSVTDSNGKKENFGAIYFGIDDKAPDLIFNGYSENEKDINAGHKNVSFDITGKVSDSYELKGLEYSVESAEKISISPNNDGTWTLSITKPNSSEKKTIEFVATDKFLRTTVKTFTYIFDLDKPNLIISDEQRTAITNKYFNQNTMVTLSGTANDVTGDTSTQSGLKVVQYGLGTGQNAENPDSLAYANTNGSAEWTVLLDIPQHTDGAYTLFVKAIDNSGNESAVEKFNITADSISPVLTVGGSSDASGTSYASGDLNLTGTVSDANFEKLTYTYTLDGVEKESNVELATSGNGNEKTWIIEKSSSALGDGTHIFKIFATDKAGNQTSLTRNIIVDKTAPIITTNVSPQIMYDNGNGEEITVNGTINVNVRVAETNKLKGVYYTEKDDSTLSDEADWSSETSFNETELAAGKTISIDTTKYADKSTLPLRIKAIDEAGNYDVVEVNPVVNQASDKPTFTPSNFVELGNKESAGWLGGNPSNVFGDTNSNMIFTLSDDDSVKEYYVKVDNGDFTKVTDVNSTQQIVSYSVKDLGYGRHTITFRVKDSNCKDDLSTTNNYVEKTYYIAIDDASPEFILANTNGEYVGSSFNITGTVSDSNGVKQIVFQPKSGGEQVYGAIDYDGTEQTKSFTYEFNVPETKDSILIIAYDSIGNATIKELTYLVDSTEPTVTISNGENAFVDGDSPSLRVAGSAVDGDLGAKDNGISGIDQVRLKIGSPITGVNDAESILTSGKIVDGVMSWSYNLDFTGKSAGSYTVYAQAFDIAGNTSTEETFTVYVDTDVPQLSHNYVDNFVGVYNGNFVIEGTASDASGVKSITAKIQGVSGNLVGNFEITEDSIPASWSFDIPANTGDGQITILVTAKDGCGKSVQETFTATLDSKAPEVTFTDIADDDDNVETIETSKTTDKPRVSVTYSDITSGVKTIDYTFYYFDTETGNFVNYGSIDGNATGTFTRDKSFSGTVTMRMAESTGSKGAFINSGTETDGKWYVKVTITDEAGNSAEYDSPYFYVDQHKPGLEVTSPKDSDLKKQNDPLTVSGSTSDINGGQIDRVIVKVTHPNYNATQLEQFTRTFTKDGSNVTELLTHVSEENYTFTYTWDVANSPFLYPDQYEVSVVTYDVAGNEFSVVRSVSCDKTAPTISFSRPYSYSVDSYGNVTSGSVVNSPIGDTNIKAIANDHSMYAIYYQVGGTVTIDSEGTLGESDYRITRLTVEGGGVSSDTYGTSAENPEGDSLASGVLVGTWNKLNSANFDFDVSYNTLTFNNNEKTYHVAGDKATIMTLDVHLVAVDEAGNINYCKMPIKVDTDTDKPNLLVLSPKTVNDVANVGGTATVSGTVNDDNSVHSVLMQIEIANDNGNYVGNILTGTDSAIFGIDYSNVSTYNMDNPQVLVENNNGTYSLEDNTAYFADRTKWYKVNLGAENSKSTTWNMVLNKFKEFDNASLYNNGFLKSNVAQTELIVRVRALDTKSGNSDISTDAKLGDITEFKLVIDSGSPSIIINNIAEFPTEGSYIGGTLNFNIDFTDDESITEWTIEALSTANGDNRSMIIDSGKFSGSYEVGLGDTVHIETSVDTEDIYTNCGNLIQIKISAKDNSKDSQSQQEAAKESYLTFKYTIDNSAPEANHVDGDYRVTTETVDGNELRETEIRGNHLRIMSDQAAFKGKVLDEANGSGVDYIMLYFTKGGYIYNPSQKDTKELLSHELSLRDENGGGTTVDFPVESLNDIARTPSANGGKVTPYIVVDRAEGMLDSGANGDLDGYNENLKANGDWVVYIESSNLPDGVYDIHYVVVDFAKNARYYHDTMLVQNNAPKITSIVLATDIDGDGVAEISSDGISDEDQKFDTGEFTSTGFIVRNSKLKLKVNVTGGTGTLKYYLRYQTTGGEVTTDENTSGYSTGIFEVTDFLGDSSTPVNYVVWVEDSVEQNLSLSSGENIIDMIMDNVDDVKPVTQLFELNTDVESSVNSNEKRGSLYKANSSVKGHIEPRQYSLVDNDSGEDPEVSGTIILRGEAMDNQRIGSISLTLGNNTKQVAVWNGTSLEAVNEGGENRATLIKNELGLSGHYVEWSYVWDTWDITNNVGYDTPVKVLVTDYSDNSREEKEYSAEYNTPHTESNKFDKDTTSWGYNSMTVDVVPYITKIETPNRTLSGLKKNNIRSASGKYSVIKGTTDDFIKVYGFNLNASSVRIVDSGEVNGAVDASTGNSLNLQDVVSPYNELSLSNDSSISGYLEIFVGDVRSINNINNNNQSYNQEPDESIKNTLLNDDRYLRFFDMKDTGIKNGFYPTMIMEGDDPVFGYVDLKGGPGNDNGIQGAIDNGGAGSYSGDHAMPQRAKFNGDNASVIYKEYLIKASIWDQMGMARDESGRYHHVTLYNRAGAAMSYIYDRYAELYTEGQGWGSGTKYQDYAGNKSESSGNNAITLEYVDYGNGLMLGRYQYPKLIAKGNSRDAQATIYMMYFDANTTNKDLIFRNFRVGLSSAKDPNDSDSYRALYSGGYATDGTTYGQASNCWDNNTTGRKSIATNASNHFAFGVTSDNHVVVVYYDEFAGKLKLKYSNNSVIGINSNNDVPFTESSIDFPDYVGNYVSMAIDENNGIHISAFDAGDSDLAYIYIPRYNGSEMKHVTVDQASAVGNWTQIKLKDGVPYIVYYNATEAGGRESIKLAYANEAITSVNTVVEGVDSDGYTTGNWEYMTVPAITAPQGGKTEFQNVCLDFDSTGKPIIGYLGENLEFGTWCDE